MIGTILKTIGFKGIVGCVAAGLLFVAVMAVNHKMSSLSAENDRLEEAINAAMAVNKQLATELKLERSAINQRANTAAKITKETSTIKSNLENVYEKNPLAADAGNIDLAGLGIIECLLPALSSGDTAAIAPCLSDGRNAGAGTVGNKS